MAVDYASDRRGSMIGKPKELKLYLSSQDQTVNGQASEVMSRCCYLLTPGLFLVRHYFLCLEKFFLHLVECFLKDEEYFKPFISGSNFVWT